MSAEEEETCMSYEEEDTCFSDTTTVKSNMRHNLSTGVGLRFHKKKKYHSTGARFEDSFDLCGICQGNVEGATRNSQTSAPKTNTRKKKKYPAQPEILGRQRPSIFSM
jgi:hypothetical protein